VEENAKHPIPGPRRFARQGKSGRVRKLSDAISLVEMPNGSPGIQSAIWLSLISFFTSASADFPAHGIKPCIWRDSDCGNFRPHYSDTGRVSTRGSQRSNFGTFYVRYRAVESRGEGFFLSLGIAIDFFVSSSFVVKAWPCASASQVLMLLTTEFLWSNIRSRGSTASRQELKVSQSKKMPRL